MPSMDSGPEILDISSDEEEGMGDPWDKQSLDWISELLEDPDDASTDPDEIVVLDELSCAAVVAPKPSISTTIEKGDSGDASDDDCLILEGDPDKPVAVVHDKDHESDELLIVGEKGDLACRDYPHPRHLCATFSFHSTPHDQHCCQCHCYVCDVVAPCAYWGIGTSAADHCHATDKEERWKMLRKSLKNGTALIANPNNSASILTPTSVDAAFEIENCTASTVTSTYDPTLPPQPPVMTRTLRACSNSSTFQNPSLVSQTQIQQPASVDGRVQQLYRFHKLVSSATAFLKEVSSVDAVPARQGRVDLQSASPLTNSRGVSSSRHSFLYTGSSRVTGHLATNHHRLHRPVYPATRQAMKVMEPPRSPRYLPAQGLWRSQRPTNLQSQKHRIPNQEPLSCPAAQPAFKRARTEPLPDALHQGNLSMSETPLDAGDLKRLNDIISGLESEIGVSNTINHTDNLGRVFSPSQILSHVPNNTNHTDNLSTAFSPSEIYHPYVLADSRQDAGILGGFEHGVTASLHHDAYNPSCPNIGYNNLSGSNVWSSNFAMTNMNANEGTSLPSVSKDSELCIASHISNSWDSYAEPPGYLDPCVPGAHVSE